MSLLQLTTAAILIGVGATVIMDVWLMLLKRLGVQTLNFALIGRWVGHLPLGQFSHSSIAKASPIFGELFLGWITHYTIGILFAALLILSQGADWISKPTFMPALLIGMGTVVAPLFVMQPAMGSGFTASKTPTPLKNCLRSFINHTVFGLGLYLSAYFIAWRFL